MKGRCLLLAEATVQAQIIHKAGSVGMEAEIPATECPRCPAFRVEGFSFPAEDSWKATESAVCYSLQMLSTKKRNGLLSAAIPM